MARRRTKSVNDMNEQLNRILQGRRYGEYTSRDRKAMEIYDRYAKRAYNSKEADKAESKVVPQNIFNTFGEQARDETAKIAARRNAQVSRSTYMAAGGHG